jgi:hypothetical protein
MSIAERTMAREIRPGFQALHEAACRLFISCTGIRASKLRDE